MTLTLEEQERLAWIQGDLAKAELLALAVDAPVLDETAIQDAYDSGHSDGYDSGLVDANAELRTEVEKALDILRDVCSSDLGPLTTVARLHEAVVILEEAL